MSIHHATRSASNGAAPWDNVGTPTDRLHGRKLQTISCHITNPPMQLFTVANAFQPNATTVRFARCIRIDPESVVFDIGTGIGPLALFAARSGARRVIGVDPVELHCQLATLNATCHNAQNTAHFLHGSLFEPLKNDRELASQKADVIIGDVSGIADTVAHALNWYSPLVPAGGEDGTDVIRAFLQQAPDHLAEGGRVYFPIASDLSDGERILKLANELFEHVENALRRPYVEFPLTEEQVQAIDDAYAGQVPPFIQIQKGRHLRWRGQILVASQPRTRAMCWGNGR